ncbi:MAG: Unknown protein [uncultured Aureispira sp.]|uniref:Uncharacterized protein n=1 Tax=uncultured Aureispira sp. TaxID=1331704 RepID=A0A6S6UKH1_9BACT|nr:MAG: Unknown protein [uncultured Aureispira sp.]
MKKLSLYFLILFPILLSAQKSFDYKVSTPYKVIDAYHKYYFSDVEKEKMISVKIDRKFVYIQTFDANTLKEIKLEKFNDFPKKYSLSEIKKIQDKIYFFYTTWDKRAKIQQLFAREINFDKCSFVGPAKKIFELNERVYFSYLYAHSQDKILIQCRKKPEKVRDAINYDKIGLYIFDENLNQLVGNEVEMPYTEKQMDNIDYHVDREGNPYLLAKVRADGSNKDFLGKGKNKTVNYHLELIKINVKNKNIKITKIKLDEYQIASIWLYEGRDKSILCAGFYNKEDKSSKNADGVFLFKVNEDGLITDKKFYEIPVEILNQYEKKITQKKNNKKDKKDNAEFSSLVIRKLIVQSDNSILLVGEQYFVVQHTYTDSNGNTQTRSSYHYYDLLVTKIDAEGALAWMRKLPKRQVGSIGKGGMGVKHMSIDGNHYFVYLDNVKNMELTLNQRPTVHSDGRGGFLTAYRLNNETGNVEKVSIFNTLDIKEKYKLYDFQTKRMLPVSKNEFIVEFYKKQKEDVLVKIKIN